MGVCCGLAAPSVPELSPCPLVRVADLLPRVKGLGSSSLGLGESLLRERNPTGELVPSPYKTQQKLTVTTIISDSNLIHGIYLGQLANLNFA